MKPISDKSLLWFCNRNHISYVGFFGEFFEGALSFFGVPCWKAFRIRNKFLGLFGGEIKDSCKALVLHSEEVNTAKELCMNFNVKDGSVIFYNTKSCAIASKTDTDGTLDKNSITFELRRVES